MGARTSTHSRLAAAVATAAMVVSGGFAAPLLTSGTAHASALPIWNLPVQVGGGQDRQAAELTALADGSSLALWREQDKLTATVQAADSDGWKDSGFSASGVASRLPVRVAADPAGGATVTWAESADPAAGEPAPATRLLTATLRGGVWSAPKELLAAADGRVVDAFQVAAGPQGTAVAVWSAASADGASSAVYTASRGTDGSWSEPAPVATASTTDPAGAGKVDGADVAVTAAGHAVVAFRRTAQDGTAGILTSERTATAGAWSTPAPAAAPAAGTEVPNAGAGPDGTLAVTWSLTHQDPRYPFTSKVFASVKQPGGSWTVPAPVPYYGFETDVSAPEPLIAPDGDVTLAWEEHWEGDDQVEDPVFSGVVTATLAKGGSGWQHKQLSTQEVGAGFDAAIGADGTVRVSWSEVRWFGNDARYNVFTAARTTDDNAWTGPRRLLHADGSGPRTGAVQTAAGAARSAAVLWTAAEGPLSTRTAFSTPKVASASVPATAVLAKSTSASVVWAPVWKLDRPADAWRLTLTDRRGKVFHNLTGVASGTGSATIAPKWNGRSEQDQTVLAANGPLSWRLSVAGRNASEQTFLASGTVTVQGGAAVHRDFGSRAGTPDGTGDFFQTTTSGSLRIAYGNPATGNFSGSSTTTGWPKGFRPIPFGDTNGDRCNDTLVRLATGEMRLYTPACGEALKPTTKHKVLGKGWNAYDVLTSSGDVTKDGRPDLIARDPKTGDLYLYTTTGTGILAPRVRISAAYVDYKKVVGAGDLNGDGVGDLLLHSDTNKLWRSYGLGNGKFGPRTLLFDDFSPSYSTLVGPGDLTGDNRPDLLARDTAGNIWRWTGTARGTFTAKKKIATGWKVYNGVH
ncbi:FG-GAP repeat domain-containing protein [Streptomyces sp. NBC_00239]|uniref:FG-GAP repeat domain-containing protein n=1 Tax=Streptomyces sp. NBC_00239 TaxID=2903640 RepID=UPI002E2A29B6|nr:VCBS repeat-containing protein [Streptomyces sp. NBC_00239]